MRSLAAKHCLPSARAFFLLPAVSIYSPSCTHPACSQRRFFDLNEERLPREFTHYEILGISKEASMYFSRIRPPAKAVLLYIFPLAVITSCHVDDVCGLSVIWNCTGESLQSLSMTSAMFRVQQALGPESLAFMDRSACKAALGNARLKLSSVQVLPRSSVHSERQASASVNAQRRTTSVQHLPVLGLHKQGHTP